MEFKFLLQSQITAIELESIVSLKKLHWDYSIEEHINWIKANIQADDIHVLMVENNELIGYLNLIKTQVIINSKTHPFLGIGNVCTRNKGKGYGKDLLTAINNYLIINSLNGILLCKNDLMGFYSKVNWVLVDDSIRDQNSYKNINFMLFNYEDEITDFKYSGRNF
ncbi:hypothetical protein ACFX5F_12100 [Flavobacterium sp. ZS1P70]|uniref:GNAT family N-acetyltransferase n=1 Tax=Flavobacterium zhoui TaxID=3230414 RepID=A0ABW6I6R4_9FLAO